MRKIDLTPYVVDVMDPEGQAVQQPFDVRKSVAAVLFKEGLAPRELIKRDLLASKVEEHSTEEPLLLEEEDYKKVVEGLDQIKNPPRHFAEFFARVLDAPEVQVGLKLVP